MIESHQKLQRLTGDKVRQYRHEADLARTLAAARNHHGWRWWLGETLLALAGRLSPTHRTLLNRLCESLESPLSNRKATA